MLIFKALLATVSKADKYSTLLCHAADECRVLKQRQDTQSSLQAPLSLPQGIAPWPPKHALTQHKSFHF